MAEIVIFGNQDFASLAHFYLTHDSEHDVVAFTVDGDYLDGATEFEGKPLVAFERLDEEFPATKVKMFAPMSHRKMNAARAEVYQRIADAGYACISYVSTKATTFTDLTIGDNCFILEDNTIQPFVKIGSNVMLWSGNHIGHHSTIGDHTFITSHVVISGHCAVGESCFLGVNAAVRDGVTLGEGTFVNLGAVIDKNTEPWTVHKGPVAEKLRIPSNRLRI